MADYDETPDGAHAGSLWAKALHDPRLRRKIEKGRKQARLDQENMEIWAGADFQSGGLTPQEGYATLEVQEAENG